MGENNVKTDQVSDVAVLAVVVVASVQWIVVVRYAGGAKPALQLKILKMQSDVNPLEARNVELENVRRCEIIT